jgi:FkbM family methyltransferase
MQNLRDKRLSKREREIKSRIPWKGGIFLPTDKFSLEDRVRGLERVLRIWETEWPKRYRYELQELRNKHEGRRRCFIIGNGPSLNQTNLDLLIDEATFGVNGIFLKFTETRFRPTFYVVDDHLVAEDQCNEINDLSEPVKLFPIYLAYCLRESPNTVFFNHQPRPRAPHDFDFSTDASEVTYTGCTVTFTCMQLAFYLGFKEIYLLGIDHNYEIPRDAEQRNTYGTQIYEIDSNDPNHFHPGYFGKGRRFHEPMIDKMEEAYVEALRVTRSKGVQIFNATIGGKLEIFPRVDYYKLFDLSNKTFHPTAVTGDNSSKSVNSEPQTNQMACPEERSSGPTKLSAIVTIYNVEPLLLEACLNSVATQILPRGEYEIIVVDDCSTRNDTISVIDQFAHRTGNIKLVRHTENLGPNEARWSGVRVANADYVLFVDGDDVLTRDALENLNLKARDTAADLVTSPAFRWSDRTKSYGHVHARARPLPLEYIARLKAVFAEYSFTVWGHLFKRTILDHATFDLPERLVHEDLSTFARVSFRARSVAHIDTPVYYYRITGAGLMAALTMDHVYGMFYAFNDWIESARHHGVFKELSAELAYGAERFVNNLVRRCLLSGSLTDDDKLRILAAINEKYRALPLPRPKTPLPGTELLEHLHTDNNAGRPSQLQQAIKLSFPDGVPAPPDIRTRFKYSLVPTEMARRLKDKVVFICQGDRELRSTALYAHELRLRGHPCAILDNSAFAPSAHQRLPRGKNGISADIERARLTRPAYGPDWLSTARLVVTFTDFAAYLREPLEYRQRLGLPSAGIIGTVNDLLRFNFQDGRHLPHRRCEYVFLGGSDDKKYFEDRQTYVVGLPIIESLATRVPRFPEEPLAVLNVNFTHDALDPAREEFIVAAKNAFAAAGYNWVITKHPMDRASLKGYPVSRLTQYELIDRCSVFVSRFSTGIVEALASGKPVIYFNPHDEKVGKSKSPLGAYEIATTEEELVHALQNVTKDVNCRVDFRERALPFLESHTGYRPGGTPAAQRLAEAVADILGRDCHPQAAVADLFLDRLHEREPFQCEDAGELIGSFEHRHRARLPEAELVARYFGDSVGTMVDVGAAYGDGLSYYLGKRWTVYAFEPAASKRRKLSDTWSSCSRLVINEEMVSDKAGSELPSLMSNRSSGVSGLFAAAQHGRSRDVRTTTLRDYYEKAGLRHVDVLRIGVKGSGKSILDGFPWESDKPGVVLVNFEDTKVTPPGYSAHELADLLMRRGYVLYVSEWLPITRGRDTHDWKRLVRYSPALEIDRAWGNMIGFLDDPGDEKLAALARQTIKFSARPGIPTISLTGPRCLSVPVQWYLLMRYRLAAYVVERHPRLAMTYRRIRYGKIIHSVKT